MCPNQWLNSHDNSQRSAGDTTARNLCVRTTSTTTRSHPWPRSPLINPSSSVSGYRGPRSEGGVGARSRPIELREVLPLDSTACRNEAFRNVTFVAAAPTAGQAVEVDQGEIVGHEWLPVREALARRDRNEIELEAARTRPVDIYETMLQRLNKRNYTVFVFAGDIAYLDSTLLERDGPRHRVELTAESWTYERTV